MQNELSPAEKFLIQLGVPPLDRLLQFHRTNASPVDGVFRSHSEVQTFQRNIEVFCALYAPIRRIPTEILLEIFEYIACSLDRAGAKDAFHRARVEHASVRDLARVCSLWRRLVFDSPTLWVRVDSEAISETSMERSLGSSATEKLVDFALRQATKHAPILDVRLQHTRKTSFTLLEREIHRDDGTKPTVMDQCKHLHIGTLFKSDDLKDLSAVAKARVSSLETLRLMVSTFAVRAGPESLEDPLDWMRGAHRLRSVAVSCIIVDRVPFHSLHALRELTCTVYFDSVAKSIEMLAILPPIVHCRLIFYPLKDLDPAEFGDDFQALPTTSAIERLSIGAGNQHKDKAPEMTDWFLQGVITRLTLPSVHTLSFVKAASGDGSPPLPLPWPHEHFLKLADSSLDSHLRTLDLRGVIVWPDEVYQCLHALPNLASLCVADHEQYTLVTNGLWTVVMLTGEDDDVALDLRTLTVHTRLEFDDTAFSDFLVSRTNDKLGFECHVGVLPGHWVHSLEDIRADGVKPQRTTDERREQLMNNEASALFELRKRKEGKLVLSFSSLPNEILV
ncbi:F-box domain-containing protein [Mycena kentingensis (nom. inval.)]|nr:F-box domain-containing protein [Mycena kentingensis (nom. inval.)]